MSLDICPNCDSRDILVRSGGRLLPFFIKRVFAIEPPTIAAFLPRRFGAGFAGLIRNIPILSLLGQYRPLDCEILICATCDFVCPALNLPDSQLLGLYRDYRSASYNRERCEYEPSYRRVADSVGKLPAEHQARMAHVDSFLMNVPGIASIRDVLDFAGADGSFIPTELRRCHCTVYEVSDERPCRPEISKVSEITQLGMFDYIQVCHLLEHVRHPKQLMKSVIQHASPGALVYIEVPKEATEHRVEALRGGGETFLVHEHINLYTEASLSALVEAIGLTLLKIESKALDMGWCRATVLSAVAVNRHAGAFDDHIRVESKSPRRNRT